ncbi:Aste57867_8594 [Aphanomyces stellatus]|uniref:Aste57867_8594 protein n=1 Tax=Aphanomyces stellatus TaxID=120398 RepID=A0A485KKT7_9STRA|nr:hypothetical protein As57867_008562 [Aphanomyces stellatus]VFT85480.1 Aste57867_8594 [Aphanomyces stellatus]
MRVTVAVYAIHVNDTRLRTFLASTDPTLLLNNRILQFAAKCESLEILQWLHGVWFASNLLGVNLALDAAATYYHVDSVRFLLDTFAADKVKSIERVLDKAMSKGQVALVRLLAPRVGLLCITRALRSACWPHDIAILDVLLDNIPMTNSTVRDRLFQACNRDDVSLARCFFFQGERLRLPDTFYVECFDRAMQCARVGIIELLASELPLRGGPKMQIHVNDVHWAAMDGHVAMLELVRGQAAIDNTRYVKPSCVASFWNGATCHKTQRDCPLGFPFKWFWESDVANAQVVARCLLQWFAVFGVCYHWVTDQGSHFKNEVIAELQHVLGAHHHFTTARCPWANGTVESAMKITLKTFRSLLSEWLMQLVEWLMQPSQWRLIVPVVMLVVNQTPSESIGGVAPITAMTGSHTMSPLDFIPLSVKAKVVTLEELCAGAAASKHQKGRDARAAKNGAKMAEFDAGDFVLDMDEWSVSPSKLSATWRGPA